MCNASIQPKRPRIGSPEDRDRRYPDDTVVPLGKTDACMITNHSQNSIIGISRSKVLKNVATLIYAERLHPPVTQFCLSGPTPIRANTHYERPYNPSPQFPKTLCVRWKESRLSDEVGTYIGPRVEGKPHCTSLGNITLTLARYGTGQDLLNTCLSILRAAARWQAAEIDVRTHGEPNTEPSERLPHSTRPRNENREENSMTRTYRQVILILQVYANLAATSRPYVNYRFIFSDTSSGTGVASFVDYKERNQFWKHNDKKPNVPDKNIAMVNNKDRHLALRKIAFYENENHESYNQSRKVLPLETKFEFDNFVTPMLRHSYEVTTKTFKDSEPETTGRPLPLSVDSDVAIAIDDDHEGRFLGEPVNPQVYTDSYGRLHRPEGYGYGVVHNFHPSSYHRPRKVIGRVKMQDRGTQEIRPMGILRGATCCAEPTALPLPLTHDGYKAILNLTNRVISNNTNKHGSWYLLQSHIQFTSPVLGPQRPAEMVDSEHGIYTIRPVTQKELYQVIQSFRGKSNPGWDSIPHN
ncbi:hypothetical protein J6590_023168 [Homalodisca vitripennis]|nr:hypothetical protein J6590_023168 [Homalodisca vitripennis]